MGFGGVEGVGVVDLKYQFVDELVVAVVVGWGKHT